jgi:hypothetical protein
VQDAFGRVLSDGSIPGSKIEPDSITSLELAPDSVTDVELADNAVDTDAIQDGAVTNDKLSGTFDGGKLAEDSVTSRELAPNSVTDVELADDAVDTGAIQDGAVTNDKVTNGIDGAKLLDGSVTNAKLADGIDGGKLVANSVTSTEIAANAIGASELADNAVDTGAIQNGAVTNEKVASGIDGAKLIGDSVTAAKIAPNAITDSELADNAVDTAAIQNAAVTDEKLASGIDGAKLTDGTVTNAKLASGIDGGKLTADSVTSTEIAPNAVGASELADNAVDTTALQNDAVTNDKVADGTLTGDRLVANTLTSREIGPNAITASELADNAVDTTAVQNAAITNEKLTSGIDGAKLVDNSVTNAKLAAGIDGGKLNSNSVTSRELAANSVTAVELANNSVDTNAIIDGSVTNAKLTGPIDGGLIDGGTLPPSAIGNVTDRGLDQSTGKIGHTNSIASGTRNGISFDAQGHITGTSALVNTDLPPATTTQLGAVIVPTTSGLTVAANGALDHTNSITAGSSYGVSFDEHGHIIGVNTVDPGELPLATKTTVGVVSVPGPELNVDNAGAITHKDSTVIPGDYPKVRVNQKGHVIAGLQLEAADIPALDASKINTGTFDPARIADRSLTNPKFADYSTVLIQEAEPPGFDYYTGQFWYQESSAQLRTWSGNSWLPVGFGRLSEENLRFCGTFDASTGTVEQITTLGGAAGLIPNSPIPAADDKLTGVYLVATTPGTFDGDTYDNGDWTLCLGQAEGWVRVDTLSGTGSTTLKLGDLLDVEITSPESGDTLIYDSTTNKWVNKPTAAEKANFVEAFDGVRTSFTLTRDAGSANNLLISIGGIIQEPGVDFTFTAPRTVNFVSPPPVGSDYWIIIEGVPSTGGGGGGGTTLPDGTSAEEYLRWFSALGSWQPSQVLDGGTYG